MANKRMIPRVRRRMRVTFNGTARFTADVSPGGFCIEAIDVLPIGADVSGELELDDQKLAYSGKVTWSVAGERKISKLGKMGVKFFGIDPRYFELYAKVIGNRPLSEQVPMPPDRPPR